MNTDLYSLLQTNPTVFNSIDNIKYMAGSLFTDALTSHIDSGNMDGTELTTCTSYLDHYFKNIGKSQFYKNPELFSSLNDYINYTGTRPKNEVLYNMGLQLDYHPFSEAAKSSTLRLYHFQNFFYVNDSKTFLSEENSIRITDRSSKETINIILPLKDIFSGLIAENIYPKDFVPDHNTDGLIKSIRTSLNLVRKYSAAIFSEIFQLINYIFLTPDFNDKKRFSYNLRAGYIGAIFINKYQTTNISFAESLIHEFIHQRLWLQWTYELPDLNRFEKIMIVSPFTDRPKSVPVMVHAYIIYNVIHDFHQFMLSSCKITSKERTYLENKIGDAVINMPLLYSRLQEKIPAGHALNDILEDVNTTLTKIKMR